TVWNVSQLQSSGDVVHVDITGNTITFTWTPGSPGLTNTFQAMDQIAFQHAVFGSGGNTITSAVGTSPSGTYTLSCGTTTGGGSCNEDGFLTNPAGAEYSTTNGGPGHPTVATFTFASSVVDGLTQNAFDVHVTFSGNCSGWVDGTLSGSASSNTNCSATPVPEPMTVFLGGTGLIALAFIG